jgi:hypothetical protein
LDEGLERLVEEVAVKALGAFCGVACPALQVVGLVQRAADARSSPRDSEARLANRAGVWVVAGLAVGFAGEAHISAQIIARRAMKSHLSEYQEGQPQETGWFHSR